MPISILERSDKNVFWFRHPRTSRSTDDDLLFRLRNEKVEAIEFPPNYASVDRVCQTGNMIAASFGWPDNNEPVRSFTMQGSKWIELPIPEGFDNSYVQKITFSGIILGYIENSDTGQIQSVAWKGKACKLLASLPNWPKPKDSQLIYSANRQGELYLIEKALRKRLIFHISLTE